MVSALLYETHTMKRFNLIPVLVFICLSSVAFAQSNETTAKQDTVGLLPFKAFETVVLGQYVDYTGSVHGSVGKQVEVNYLNDSILNFIGSEVTYRSQESPMPSGGDGGYKSFLFRATQLGETTITIQEIYRGEIQKEYTIKVTVVAAKKDRVKLIPLKGKETVEIGQSLEYTGSVHGSVGVDVEVNQLNDNILEFLGSEVTYKSKVTPMPSGGDSGSKTFLFRATEVGETTLTIREIYRGAVRKEYSIAVTVVATKED